MTADALDDPIPPGTSLGRYRIERQIAEGGMALVYEATHLDLMKRVALKVMRAAYAGDSTLLQRFVLEARAASRLQHPHVSTVSDFGVERGRPYMVLDLLEGEDLSRIVGRLGPLPVERLVDLVLPIVSAICAAHAEGILHRDLKPENVFVTRRQGREYPMLLDFGVSGVPAGSPAPPRTLTRAGESVGTPFYMSPEHVTGARDLDGRTDQYSLGVLLYECLTGTLPYEGATLHALLARIAQGGAPPPTARRAGACPPELEAVILRAMAVSRNDRFPTMRDFGRALWPFASPITQAIWVEELGDPEVVAARMSPPAQPVHAATAPTPGGAELVVTPADLGSFEAFEALPRSAVDAFLRVTRGRRFPRGATIIRQGSRGHGCFLLVSGEVDVVKTVTTGSWILGRLQPGSVFGQISLVDHVPRTASVVAVGDVGVVAIDRGVFEGMLAETNEVAQALREQVARSGIRQLRRATHRLAELLRGTPVRAGRDPRRELVYLQAAAHEWSLPIEDVEEPAPARSLR